MRKLTALFNRQLSSTATESLSAMTEAAKKFFQVSTTKHYTEGADVLLIWGAGGAEQSVARQMQLSQGGRVVMLDVGYVRDPPGRNRMFRISVDDPHPQRWLSQTDDSHDSWSLQVQERTRLGGRILVVDMGPKSVKQYGISDWARSAVLKLEARGFNRHSMIHRPKPRNPFLPVPGVAYDNSSSIQDLLDKSFLVVTHHSNVGVEAAIHGVPVETEDGAAAWLLDKPWTYENRVSFINRLSRWQYRPSHSKEAWEHLRGFLE